MRFTKAIVRTPCEEMINGLTTSNLGRPDYNKALIQHSRYIDALRSINREVTVLDPNNNYPDSVFIEDYIRLSLLVCSFIYKILMPPITLCNHVI